MRNDEVRNDGTDRLVPLSNLKDFKVAKDNPDVRGWRIVGADGESLGMVKDLIVDPQEMKARYLSVVADRKFFNTDDDPYMLVPIGAAALDKKGRKIFVSHIDSKTIGNYPVYPGGPIPEDYEYSVREAFNHSHNQNLMGNPTSNPSENQKVNVPPPTTPRRISNDFYENDHYNENQFYGSNRTVEQPDTTTTYVAHDTTTAPTTQRPLTDTSNHDSTPKNVEDSIATIERLEQLRAKGSLTDEEFNTLKKRALDI